MKINMDTPASCIREDTTTKCISGQFNNSMYIVITVNNMDTSAVAVNCRDICVRD